MAQIHPRTETAVANEALSLLKQPELVDLVTDSTQTARIVKKHFASTRDALLRRYPWNFNATRKLLEAQVEGPLFGFKYLYGLPNDCASVREVYGCSKDAWKVEKRGIVTDMPPPLKIIYGRWCPEVALWDTIFRSAMVRSLAAAVGPELSAEESRIRALELQAENILLQAFPSDAAEGTSDEIPDSNFNWLAARR